MNKHYRCNFLNFHCSRCRGEILDMKLDQKQIRLLVNLQSSLEQKEVKFLVFHEEQKYTVTNELEEALNINSTIFIITSKNIVALGPVHAETKDEIQQQVEVILSIVQNEQMDSLADLKVPLLEHPTYTADIFTVIAFELEYDREDLHRMLIMLERMLPIYREYFQNNRKEDVIELSFVAEKLLLKVNKSPEVTAMFIQLVNEKIHVQQSKIEEQASSVLTRLLFEQLENR